MKTIILGLLLITNIVYGDTAQRCHSETVINIDTGEVTSNNEDATFMVHEDSVFVTLNTSTYDLRYTKSGKSKSGTIYDMYMNKNGTIGVAVYGNFDKGVYVYLQTKQSILKGVFTDCRKLSLKNKD